MDRVKIGDICRRCMPLYIAAHALYMPGFAPMAFFVSWESVNLFCPIWTWLIRRTNASITQLPTIPISYTNSNCSASVSSNSNRPSCNLNKAAVCPWACPTALPVLAPHILPPCTMVQAYGQRWFCRIIFSSSSWLLHSSSSNSSNNSKYSLIK